jgi:hypothetical protein
MKIRKNNDCFEKCRFTETIVVKKEGYVTSYKQCLWFIQIRDGKCENAVLRVLPDYASGLFSYFKHTTDLCYSILAGAQPT